MLVIDIFVYFSALAEANAALQRQLGEANTVLRAKEVECNELAQEHARLAMQVAEQAELLQTARKEVEVKESNLLAEFKTERSTWTDKEALLKSGFGRIEDMVDGKLSSFSFFGLPTTDRAGFQLLIF